MAAAVSGRRAEAGGGGGAAASVSAPTLSLQPASRPPSQCQPHGSPEAALGALCQRDMRVPGDGSLLALPFKNKTKNFILGSLWNRMQF